jgi:Holliday junction resolvasome RuvABC endonuclease subunit
MKFLALDISSRNTGWTLLENGIAVATGDISPSQSAAHPEKLDFFRKEVVALLKSYAPGMLCIEDVWAGKNKLTYKILSLYHGIVYQLSHEFGTSLKIMTPSRFRRIVGAIHNIKLNYADREDAKKAVGTLVCSLYPALSSSSEDVHDSIGIALAAYYWQSRLDLEIELVKSKNPKIKSVSRIEDLAEAATESYFKGLEKENAKSVGNPGSDKRKLSGRNKKGLQKVSPEVSPGQKSRR